MTLLVVAALVTGLAVGRSTAPKAQVRESIRPATAITDIGARSIGDLRRAQYHRAMNRLHQPVGGLANDAVLSSWMRSVEGFRAANELLPQQS